MMLKNIYRKFKMCDDCVIKSEVEVAPLQYENKMVNCINDGNI